MPNASTMAKFLEARRTGKTDVTRALDSVFTSPGHLQGDEPALFTWLSGAHALDQPLTPEARNFLKGLQGGLSMSDADLDHIDDWPSNQKEKVRRKLVKAIEEDRNVKFVWKLHNGDTELTDREDPGPPGGITIKFRSPWNNVKLSATGDEVTVDVG